MFLIKENRKRNFKNKTYCCIHKSGIIVVEYQSLNIFIGIFPQEYIPFIFNYNQHTGVNNNMTQTVKKLSVKLTASF